MLDRKGHDLGVVVAIGCDLYRRDAGALSISADDWLALQGVAEPTIELAT